MLDVLPPLPGFSPAKRRVYAAAVELFGSRGYHAVSLRDLANHLGIKAPSIYAHVPTKQDLLFDLTMIGQREFLDRIRGALIDAGSDPREQVEAVVRAHVLTHLQLPLLARVASVELRHLDEQHLAEVLILRGESGRVFIDVITRGQRQGAFHVDNPTRFTRAIADMGIRIAEWTPSAAPSEHASLVDDYVEIALRILGYKRTA